MLRSTPHPPPEHHTHPSRRDLLHLLGLASLAPFADRLALAQVLTAATPTAATTPKYFGRFAELPVGTVKPLGWTAQWLQRQAAGLTGHPENMAYPFDTCMLAGRIPAPAVAHGDSWWRYEQSGYFFDAVTRLSHLIDDPRIHDLHQRALDNILLNSTDRGYGANVDLWPNAVIGRGLLADYSAAKTPERKAALAAVIERVTMTHPWAYGRSGVNAEEALYLYSTTGDPRLLAFAIEAYKNYTSTRDNSFCAQAKIEGVEAFHSHGVTAAETLKMLALAYLYSGDPEALDLTVKAYNKVIANGLMPDGAPVSSEDLGTAVFNSLHETCDISDWTWSMGYCLMATGDTKWADLIERSIFNALPGAVTKDFKQFQYFSCANQILATSTSSHNNMTRMSYRAAHDTECCGGNVNRAMPNYVIRQWMTSADPARPGLYAVLYGPCVVTAELGGAPVTITQSTDYPFRDTIAFKIQTVRPALFDLHLRIPGWCTAASLKLNHQAVAGRLEPASFVTLSRRFKHNDLIELTLPMEIRTEDWFEGNSLVLTRGPLVYSLQIAQHRVELTEDTPRVQKNLNGNYIQGFPAVEFTPMSEWRFGIESAVKANLAGIKVVETPMTANPFETGQSPVHLELSLRRLPNWKPHWTAGPVPEDARVVTPATLPSHDEVQNADAATMQTLVPYGSTHLRLTTLPLLPATSS